MRTGIFLEYVGEISTDLLWQNVTNPNALKPSLQDFRNAFPMGFTMSVQIEQEIHETPEEKKSVHEFIQGRLRRGEALDAPGRKLVGVVLTPKG